MANQIRPLARLVRGTASHPSRDHDATWAAAVNHGMLTGPAVPGS